MQLRTSNNVGFELKVLVETMSIPGTDGVVVASRILPEDRPFIEVLRRALANKVPKLVGTPADKHILLLEDGRYRDWILQSDPRY